MTRRFPPGAVSLPSHRVQLERIVQLVGQASPPIPKAKLRTAIQTYIRDPETGDAYGDGTVRRLTSDLINAGFVRVQNRGDGNETGGSMTEIGTLWPTGRQYLKGECSFPEFVWGSLKRGWVLEGNAATRIEGLERVLYHLVHADEPLSKGAIEDRLAEEDDYEFSSNGIRGYPQLLQFLGAVEEATNGYVPTETADSSLGKFRDVDLFRCFEQWIRREGPTGEIPKPTVKRDMAKYYMYRESGGWGKQDGWLQSFRRDYLDDTTQAGERDRPMLGRDKTYIDAENRRSDLRDRVVDRHGLDRSTLSGLPTDVLKRAADAETAREARHVVSAAGPGVSQSDLELLADTERESYTFPEPFSLYDWQREAADAWAAAGPVSARRGIAQVVTGAGTTVMALEVIREFLNDTDDGVVSVIVPTKVLMQQWLHELVEKLNVPMDDLGWAGDGHREGFSDGRRVVVSIVNTAVKDDFLEDELAAVKNPPHLLMADECHRYTGEKFSNIFDYHRTAELGLSATPTSSLGRDEDPNEDEVVPDEMAKTNEEGDDRTPADELLLSELGDIYYNLSYDEALSRNLIPPFEVNYVGFELTEMERTQYDAYTRKISNAIGDIDARYGDQLYNLNGNFAQNLNTIRGSVDGPTPAITDYFEFTSERRDLVANAIARQAITLKLLEGALEDDQKSIVFQERIEQLEQLVAPHENRGRNPRSGALTEDATDRQQLYEQYPNLEDIDLAVESLFDRAGYKPVMYHSGHAHERWNDFAMEWFRDEGFANTMLSVKALIEGVDVPSADVGIIRVSNSSLRQRIQTLGRVLRTGEDATKRSQLYVLYARDTVDERLFEEYDWDQQLASAEINHYYWETTEDGVLSGEIVSTNEPLPSPDTGGPTPPDPVTLDRGDPYNGPRDGFRFSVDSQGRPFKDRDGQRSYITNPKIEDLAEYVSAVKGGGRIIINEANHAIVPTEDGHIFLAANIDPNEFEYEPGEFGSEGLTGEAPESVDDIF